jgi:hypothetical protein
MAMRKLSWLVGIIIALTSSVLWWVADAPLATQPQTVREGSIDDDNGFVYLLGLDARENENPYELGKSRVLHYRRWLQYPALTAAPDIPGIRTFRAPLWFDGSFETLATHAKDLPYIVATNATLYSRYHAFLQFKQFDTLIDLDAQTTEALSESVQLGNRFMRADVLSKALTGAAPAAASLLIDDITAWRTQLVLADSISHKLLAARLLTNDFSLMIALAQKNAWPPETLDLLTRALEPFSLQEMSIERPLLSAEFKQMAHTLLKAKQNPELINAGSYKPWYFSIGYKPNMSINFLYRGLVTIAKENNVPPRQLFIALQNSSVQQLNTPLSEWLKNPIGITAVQQILASDFSSYTATLWDIEVNRLLTRLILEATLTHADHQAALEALIAEPRFRGVWDHQSPRLNIDNKQLCYNILSADGKTLRCADIRWLLHKAP